MDKFDTIPIIGRLDTNKTYLRWIIKMSGGKGKLTIVKEKKPAWYYGKWTNVWSIQEKTKRKNIHNKNDLSEM